MWTWTLVHGGAGRAMLQGPAWPRAVGLSGGGQPQGVRSTSTPPLTRGSFVASPHSPADRSGVCGVQGPGSGGGQQQVLQSGVWKLARSSNLSVGKFWNDAMGRGGTPKQD